MSQHEPSRNQLKSPTDALADLLSGDAGHRRALIAGEHADPHLYLGPHAAVLDGASGSVVRYRHPAATAAEVWVGEGSRHAMTALGDGFFAAFIPHPSNEVLDYRIAPSFADGGEWESHDPYGFPPTVDDFDLYLFAEGTHQELWKCFGARCLELSGVTGWSFVVWAPNARRVSVVGDFCYWDGRLFPMRRLGDSGVFELFIPGLEPGMNYKFEILGADGAIHLKADPLAAWSECPPATASRLYRSSYRWGDQEWLASRPADPARRPMAIYEVHAGSWRRGPRGEVLDYHTLAREMVAHVKELGFNYIELLPVAEHPYSPSWGYQLSGYFAPTSRFGEPDDLRYLIDHCHQNGVGVIIDWVPSHFVKDAHGLGRFDGSALYEHSDPRQGEHPDWGTYIFNLGRHEVKSFLLSNALFWLEDMHVDGLRVDAVASMLYLDYSRRDGEWIPNKDGGNENFEAIDFLRHFNGVVHQRLPGIFTAAEESTAWPGVSKEAREGGLGFDFKWNMGWMHDTLAYFEADPLFRRHHQDQLTFAMIYEYSERFMNPLSHDEVVHGKGSLYNKMPGDAWRKLANLRALYAYQYTRPGKPLLFMGSELAPLREWDSEGGLDWYLLDDPGRAGLAAFVAELGRLYRSQPALWEGDPDPEGFAWIACWDRDNSIFAFERRRASGPAGSGEEEKSRAKGVDHLVVVLNLTPVPHDGYRLGAPAPGRYRVALSSDEERFGGSGYDCPAEYKTRAEPWDERRQSLELVLPPLSAMVLAPV